MKTRSLWKDNQVWAKFDERDAWLELHWLITLPFVRFRWKRGPVIQTRNGVNYWLRFLEKGHRKFWNGSFMPSERLGNPNGNPNKRHPLGRMISIGCGFFAIYRGF